VKNNVIFFSVLFFAELLVLLQGWLSWKMGYLTATQLRKKGIVGRAFIRHGGMWADFFLMSPLVAYIVSRYDIGWCALSFGLLVASMTICMLLGGLFAGQSVKMPEAHAINGEMTMVGLIHGVYAVLALWVILLFYIKVPMSESTCADLPIVTTGATLTVIFGVRKFYRDWRFEWPTIMAVTLICATAWSISFYKVESYWNKTEETFAQISKTAVRT